MPIILVLTLALVAALPVTAAAAAQQVNPRAAALAEFARRTRDYMELHAQVEADLPPLAHNATPDQIEQHRRRLADGIRAARRHAKLGDVFIDGVVPQFRAAIRHDLNSREMRDALAALEEVPWTQDLRVNASWPEEAARATVPARILKNLHRLPEGLEYRFFGRHLVLVDSGANLIVDYVTNVVPSMLRRR
ncbi:MAG TPA: hypothetical protein VNK41_02365 [Vicinamibacterales bacterium]|nr:hypothetical protein [Vicinamibacterales bacterium]